MKIVVRPGRREDLPHVLELVKELALYERAPEQVTNTVERMEYDGFGPNPVYGMFVACREQEGSREDQIIGISVYYYRYSTWKGKRLYLEDIIVTEKERGKGIGKMLFDRTLQKSLEENCTGVAWQVLDWNTPAIEFYKRYDAAFSAEWLNCSIESDRVTKLISSARQS